MKIAMAPAKPRNNVKHNFIARSVATWQSLNILLPYKNAMEIIEKVQEK